MGYDKDRAIAIQNAGSIAAAVMGPYPAAGYRDLDDYLAEFDKVREHVYDVTIAAGWVESVAKSFEDGPKQSDTRRSYSSNSGDNRNNPLTLTIRSGKHEGKTIGQVLDEDRDYAEWFIENGKNTFLVDKFKEAMAA